MKIKLPAGINGAAVTEAIKQEMEARGKSVTVTKRKRNLPGDLQKLRAKRRAKNKLAKRSKRRNRG